MRAAARVISSWFNTLAPLVLRNREQDRQHAPAALHINHLDTPLPGIPAPRRKERSASDQPHGVMVCRPEILEFHTIGVSYLLAASARAME